MLNNLTINQPREEIDVCVVKVGRVEKLEKIGRVEEIKIVFN
jgi:hypothetical protein